MPPKTVVCSICNQEVLKAHTLAREDGSRACRVHRGVEEESANKQQADKLKERQRADELRKRRTRCNSPDPSTLADAAKFREEFYSHCWTCGKEGISISDHFANCMVAQKRLEIRREFNFLSLAEDTRKLLGYDVGEVLAMLPYDDSRDYKIRREITHRGIKGMIHFLRVVNMCVDCISRHNIKDRLEALIPKPTWEQLEAMLPVVALVDPVLKDLAEKKERQS